MFGVLNVKGLLGLHEDMAISPVDLIKLKHILVSVIPKTLQLSILFCIGYVVGKYILIVNDFLQVTGR